MADETGDQVFSGAVSELYERLLVPLIFQPYADDVAQRLAGLSQGALLEVAAGTGVVTRALASVLPETVAITATDLNQPMLDGAIAVGTSRPVEWRQADAMSLPFPDETFDAVVCQFGVMFFPDKVEALAEMRRVMKPGGRLVFNVWDRIETNEFAETVTRALGASIPDDPPLFLQRTPHGYHDPAVIQADVEAAGFKPPIAIEGLEVDSHAADCLIVARAYCHGTPLRDEIESRWPGRLDEITQLAADAIEARFGSTDISGQIRAWVVDATHQQVSRG